MILEDAPYLLAEKEAGYFEMVKAVQKAAPKSWRPALTRASNFVADPKTQHFLHDITEGLTTDAIVFGEGGLASAKSIPNIIKRQGVRAVAHPTVWSFPTYTAVQEAGKGLYRGAKKLPEYLPGTARHVERISQPVLKAAHVIGSYTMQEKVGEDLKAFLKRIEDQARQKNLNIFMIAESRDPSAKQKSGTVTLNMGMSPAIREAGRAHKRFKQQTSGTKMSSYEDGRDLVLTCAGMEVV